MARASVPSAVLRLFPGEFASQSATVTTNEEGGCKFLSEHSREKKFLVECQSVVLPHNKTTSDLFGLKQVRLHCNNAVSGIGSCIVAVGPMTGHKVNTMLGSGSLEEEFGRGKICQDNGILKRLAAELLACVTKQSGGMLSVAVLAPCAEGGFDDGGDDPTKAAYMSTVRRVSVPSQAHHRPVRTMDEFNRVIYKAMDKLRITRVSGQLLVRFVISAGTDGGTNKTPLSFLMVDDVGLCTSSHHMDTSSVSTVSNGPRGGDSRTPIQDIFLHSFDLKAAHSVAHVLHSTLHHRHNVLVMGCVPCSGDMTTIKQTLRVMDNVIRLTKFGAENKHISFVAYQQSKVASENLATKPSLSAGLSAGGTRLSPAASGDRSRSPITSSSRRTSPKSPVPMQAWASNNPGNSAAVRVDPSSSPPRGLKREDLVGEGGGGVDPRDSVAKQDNVDEGAFARSAALLRAIRTPEPTQKPRDWEEIMAQSLPVERLRQKKMKNPKGHLPHERVKKANLDDIYARTRMIRPVKSIRDDREIDPRVIPVEGDGYFMESDEEEAPRFRTIQNCRSALRAIFTYYTTYGERHRAGVMSSAKFMKFAKEVGVFDLPHVTNVDVDIAFVKISRGVEATIGKTMAGDVRLVFDQFVQAVAQLAALCYPDVILYEATDLFLRHHVLPKAHVKPPSCLALCERCGGHQNKLSRSVHGASTNHNLCWCVAKTLKFDTSPVDSALAEVSPDHENFLKSLFGQYAMKGHQSGLGIPQGLFHVLVLDLKSFLKLTSDLDIVPKLVAQGDAMTAYNLSKSEKNSREVCRAGLTYGSFKNSIIKLAVLGIPDRKGSNNTVTEKTHTLLTHIMSYVSTGAGVF